MQYSIQIFCQETISFIFEIEFVYNYVFCSRNKASGEVGAKKETFSIGSSIVVCSMALITQTMIPGPSNEDFR